jgi:hypothetical protein
METNKVKLFQNYIPTGTKINMEGDFTPEQKIACQAVQVRFDAELALHQAKACACKNSGGKCKVARWLDADKGHTFYFGFMPDVYDKNGVNLTLNHPALLDETRIVSPKTAKVEKTASDIPALSPQRTILQKYAEEEEKSLDELASREWETDEAFTIAVEVEKGRLYGKYRRLALLEAKKSGKSIDPGSEEFLSSTVETPPTEEKTPPTEEKTPPTEEKTPPTEEETPPTEEETPPTEEETPPVRRSVKSLMK